MVAPFSEGPMTWVISKGSELSSQIPLPSAGEVRWAIPEEDILTELMKEIEGIGEEF